MATKFIHTADWHLGMQAHFLPEEPRARFTEDRFAAIRAIAELAKAEDCEFMVVAGDVFDSNHVDRGVIARALEALASFTVPVFLLPGNHDPFDASSVYKSPEWHDRCPDVVRVITDPVAVPVGEHGKVEVVGVPWFLKHQLGDPVADGYMAESSSQGSARVLIGHGIVDELSPDRDHSSLIQIAGIKEGIESGTVAYLALGDRHSVTEIENSGGRAWYAGTPVATDYDQLRPNEVLLVEIDGESCYVESRDVGSWTFVKKSFDLNGPEDIDELESWLQGVSSKQSTAVKLALRGTLSLAENARLDEILDHSSLTFASLNRWERHTDLAIAPDDGDLSQLNVSGYVREALDELAAQASEDDHSAEVSRDALNLLYRLAQ